MVRKKLAAAIAALGALQAGVVSALGVGDFSLYSALNQPLEAEIRILNAGDLDPSQVLIELAGGDDFKNAGVSRDYFLTNIQFAVELDGKGSGVIKITTRDPVVEPYLNFLIEARWPSGRLLREYTVLLDLPVFSESGAASIEQASTEQIGMDPGPQAAPAPAAASVGPSTSARKTLVQGELAAGEEYRVRTNDTLWEIAAKGRPNRGVSVQQTMLGIQRLNPEAFIRGNINRLKAGSVLRLPTESQIADVSGAQAVAEVASQNQAWRSGSDSVSSSATSGAQLDASSSSYDSEEGYQEDSRLSLATTGSSDGASAGDGSSATGQALRNELALSEENLDSARRENHELGGRLDDMESKIATLQRLLELKDDQLAALQGGVVDEAAPTDDMGVDDTSTEGTDTEGAGTEDTAAEDMAGEDTGVDAMVAESAVTETPEPAEEPVPEPDPVPAPEPELLDKLLAEPLYLGGGVGLLLLAGAAVVMLRRRRAAEEEEEEFESFTGFEQDDDEFTPADETLRRADFPEIEEEEEIDVAEDLAAELEQEIAASNAEEEALAEPEEAAPVQSETGDAIAEADIYVAYGRYQQAVDLLSSAVAQEPQRSDLQVKLLEVYIETRDKPGFQQQYVALQALGDDEATAGVKEMLSTVEGVADWLDDLPGGAANDFTDADMDADLIEGDSGGDLSLDEDLEIDLDLDDGFAAGNTQESEQISLDGDELDLDEEFSLDLGDEEFDIASGDTAQFDAIDLDSALEGDLGDLDLGGLAEETPAASDDNNDLLSELPAEEEPAAESEFDLDLDLGSDSDLDLDLGDMGDTDIGDLEAEFGDAKPQDEEITQQFDAADIELALGADDELEVDLVEESAPEADLDLDLDLDAGLDLDEAGAGADAASGDDTATMEFSLDEATAAKDESFDAAVSEEPGAEDDFDFLADTDEVATKLDLARAYIDMGDTEGARDILDEVKEEGNDDQKKEADALIERID